jgi:hypothetical protein
VGPCQHCARKKLGCSLTMPNEATGKTARGKLNPEVVQEYHIWQYEMHKGKQPAHGPGKVGEVGEGSGSGALPSEMLRVLELDSGSSQSPVEAPPSDALARCTCMQGAETPLVPFYIQVPTPPKTSRLSAATAAAAIPTPAAAASAPAACSCTHAPARPPAGTTFRAPAHAPDRAPNPTTVHAPISPPAPPAPSAPGTPTTAHVSPAAAVASSAAALPVTADSPGTDICISHSAGSPALTHTAPALCRFVVPRQCEVLTLPSPSHWQQVDTDAMPGRVPGDPQLT